MASLGQRTNSFLLTFPSSFPSTFPNFLPPSFAFPPFFLPPLSSFFLPFFSPSFLLSYLPFWYSSFPLLFLLPLLLMCSSPFFFFLFLFILIDWTFMFVSKLKELEIWASLLGFISYFIQSWKWQLFWLPALSTSSWAAWLLQDHACLQKCGRAGESRLLLCTEWVPRVLSRH